MALAEWRDAGPTALLGDELVVQPTIRVGAGNSQNGRAVTFGYHHVQRYNANIAR